MRFLQWFDVFVPDVEAALVAKGQRSVQWEHVDPVEGGVEEVARHVQVCVARLERDHTRIESVNTSGTQGHSQLSLAMHM